MLASCLCGALHATIADDAEPMTIICHCTDCQKRTGSPFGVMAYFTRELVTIEGQAREYSRPTDTGNVFTTGFCPECGSTLLARGSRFPDIIGIALGTIADPAFPAPARSVYEQSRHHWVIMPKVMPRHPRGRDS